MPSFWPFGRNKKKKLASATKNEEKLHEEQHNASKGQILTLSGITRDSHYSTTHPADQPVDLSQLDAIESFPSPHGNRHANEAPEHRLDSAATSITRQTSVSSAHNQEPLIEIEDLAGGIHHRSNTNIPNTIYEQHPEASPIVQRSPENANTFTTQPLYSLPTLRPKRSSVAAELQRSKSIKSRTSIRDREREIRSRTSPIPVPVPKRPSSFVSGVFSRSSTKTAANQDRRVASPDSGLSSPMAPSLRTDFSGESAAARSYKVTALDALRPWPRIRHGQSPRSPSTGDQSQKSSKRKDKGRAIPEQVPPMPNPRSRIKDLANDLDARALREVMDRDKRRTDRKKAVDHKKLQEKLEKQKAIEKPVELVEQVESIELEGSPVEIGAITPPPEPETEIEETGRITPLPDLEMEDEKNDHQATAVVPRKAVAPPLWTRTKSREETSPISPILETSLQQTLDPAPLISRRTTETSIPWQSDSRRISSEQVSIRDDAVIDTATAVRLSTISMSPPASPIPSREPIVSPSILSSITTGPRDSPEPLTYASQAAEIPSIPRQPSRGNVKQGSSWTSIFRRGGTKRKISMEKARDLVPQTEFSNLSRESFQRRNIPSPGPLIPQRSFQRNEGTLQRKQSKFREHLSEHLLNPPADLPISPPRSQMHSPEPDDRPLSPYLDDTRKLDQFNNDDSMTTPIEDVHPALRDQLTRSREHSLQGQTLDTALLSQSLASIDSEGSWLSGRPQKRTSAPITESLVSLNQLEDVEPPDFARRDVTGNTGLGLGGLTSQLRGLQPSPTNAEISPRKGRPLHDADVKYDAVHGHRPNIVQRASIARSREGLLEEFPPYDDDSPVSPMSPEEMPESPNSGESSVHRATSVTLRNRGGLARQLNAGSARLLDIPPRTSSDTKRSSLAMSASNPQSPLSSPAEFRASPDP